MTKYNITRKSAAELCERLIDDGVVEEIYKDEIPVSLKVNKLTGKTSTNNR